MKNNTTINYEQLNKRVYFNVSVLGVFFHRFKLDLACNMISNMLFTSPNDLHPHLQKCKGRVM